VIGGAVAVCYNKWEEFDSGFGTPGVVNVKVFEFVIVLQGTR